jgi:hypothetical protein
MVVGVTYGAVRRVELGPTVDADSDYCGVVELEGLPPGSEVKLDVSFVGEAKSEKLNGSFRTPGAGDVSFASPSCWVKGAAPRVARQCGVQRHCADPAPIQLVDLILHHRDER